MPLCLALVHCPVVNKHGKTTCSSITNFDIHDIARSCRTFGLDRYFCITPSDPQQWLARRIIAHWQKGWGATYNPNRTDALNLIEVVYELGDVVDRCQELWGKMPILVGTSARSQPGSLKTDEMKERLRNPDEVYCLIFGTAWGLHPTLIQDLDFFLEPICGHGDYNHLSVRAAVAIYLDRLCSRPSAQDQRQTQTERPET